MWGEASLPGRIFAICTFGITSAAPALAQDCPTSAALDADGIRLIQTDPPLFGEFRRVDGRIVGTRLNTRLDQFPRQDLVYRHGLLPPDLRTDEGTALATEFEGDAVEMLRSLDTLGTWRAEMTIADIGTVPSPEYDGGSRVFDYRLDFMQDDVARLGDCTYPAWRVRATLTSEGEVRRFEYLYVPEFDLSFASDLLRENGERAVFFQYDSIAAN